MRTSQYFSIVALIVLLMAGNSQWLVTTAKADGFSNEDVDGEYGYSLSGTTTDPFGNQIAVAAIGQILAANGVAIRHTRTFNIGGIGIVDGTLAGRVEIGPDGRGVAVFCADNSIRPPSVLPFFPRKSLEIFEIVLTGKNSNEILFMGNRFDPLPDDFDIANCPGPSQIIPGPSSGGVVVGTVRRQDHEDSDDD